MTTKKFFIMFRACTRVQTAKPYAHARKNDQNVLVLGYVFLLNFFVNNETYFSQLFLKIQSQGPAYANGALWKKILRVRTVRPKMVYFSLL